MDAQCLVGSNASRVGRRVPRSVSPCEPSAGQEGATESWVWGCVSLTWRSAPHRAAEATPGGQAAWPHGLGLLVSLCDSRQEDQ